MQYEVVITETHTYTIKVEADSVQQAKDLAFLKYDSGTFDASPEAQNAAIDYEDTAVYNVTTGAWDI